MTLGGRLRDAIEAAEMSVREFQRRVGPDGREAPGSSYPNIHRYLADKAEPSLEFLRTAADVLNVRYAWLTVGAPPRTADEQARREAVETEPGFWLEVMAGELYDDPEQEEREPEWRGVLRGIREGYGTGGERLISHPLIRTTVLATWATLTNAGAFHYPESQSAQDFPYDSGKQLGAALRGPLNALDIHSGDLTDAEFVEFISSVCQALRSTAPHTARLAGDRKEEDSDA